jgi:UDP-glucose 4-epimerase
MTQTKTTKTDRPFLLTGAAGFIGRHVMRALRGRNLTVVGVDWDQESVERAVDRDGGAMRLSSFDDADIIRAVAAGDFSCIVHLAATARVPFSVQEPVETHINNVERSLRLLDACRSGRSRMVFAGSSSVYGDTTVCPTPESAKAQPMTPYGLQKYIMDEYIRIYGSLYGMDAVSLRFFNVFGPGQYPGGTYPMAITAWSWAIARGTRAEIYGDGSIRRDYTFVDDVCRGIVMAATRNEPFCGQAINLPASSPVTMLKVWNCLLNASGKSHELHFMPPRAGDPSVTWGDNYLAQKELGWTPEISFQEGVEKTWEWVKEEVQSYTSESIPA